MKYKITLKGKTYEVLVEQGEAIIEDEYDYVPPVAPVAAAPVMNSLLLISTVYLPFRWIAF